MLAKLKRSRIINKALNNTVKAFAQRKPEIEMHLFYGAYDISPRDLVVWYIFGTDSELVAAKESGYCDEIENLTFRNLISCGYPEEAFVPSEGRKVSVCFASQEDIDKKADGDYRLYFQ